MKYLYICVCAACLIAGTVFAQAPVNPEEGNPDAETASVFSYTTPKVKEPAKKRWFYALSGWYERKTGNTDTLKANGQSDLVFDDNLSEFQALMRVFYGENRHVVYENKGSGLVRYDQYVLPRIELFTFTHYEYNSPAKLAHRSNTGVGVKLVFFKNDFWKMDLSGAPVYQYEDYENRDLAVDYRWSLRYRLLVTPLEFVALDFVSFYIPRIDDTGRYRFSVESSLKVKLASHVSFTAGYLHQYNRNAYPGTQRVDDTFFSQLSLTL